MKFKNLVIGLALCAFFAIWNVLWFVREKRTFESGVIIGTRNGMVMAREVAHGTDTWTNASDETLRRAYTNSPQYKP